MKVIRKIEKEVLLIGGNAKAIKRALELKEAGQDVMLAVEECFLGGAPINGAEYRSGQPADFLEEKPFFTPDDRKKALEDLLSDKGIYFCYGLYYLKEERGDSFRTVSFGSKGGIYEVCCKKTEDFTGLCERKKSYIDEREPESRSEQKDHNKIKRKIGYSAWMERGEGAQTSKAEVHTGEDKTGPECLRVESFYEENVSLAYVLADLQEKLLILFAERKKKEPDLILGRFASLMEFVEEQEEQTKDKVWEKEKPEDSGEAGTEAETGTEARAETGTETETEAYQVIVAGGGTAGAMAALHAARGGAKTLLLEPCYGLGGTATLGGVSTYWFGMRFDDVKEIDRETERISKFYGIEQKPGIWSDYDDFHPGVRSHVLLKLCLEAGVDLELGRLVCGTVLEESRVKAVRAAGSGGEKIYRGDLIVDATGDGDLAVFSGAESNYGSERDGLTYWASLAQYTSVRNYKNNFSSTTVCEDPDEMTRFVCVGRKRGENTFDHGTYVSMRESRHIKGIKHLDLRDLCLGTTWEDGLYTCFSNYDPKGKADADMIYCGYLPPQARIQIPLGALMPVTEEGKPILGLYLAGKAISVSHNLFPSIRMQPDLMHQGAVLGILAAEAVGRDCLIEEIGNEERKELIRKKTGDSLEAPFFNAISGQEVEEIGRATRTHSVDLEFTEVEETRNPLLAAVCLDKTEILPKLKEQIRRLEGKPEEQELLHTLKKLALWHGCKEYETEIVEGIRSKLKKAGDLLPQRQGSVMCAQLLPDHGVMPELVYELNLLSNLKNPPGDLFLMVAERLGKMERNYLNIKQGIYPYMESTAYVAERTGSRELIPALRCLIRLPEFSGILEKDKQMELMTERLQILYLSLSRALAALGGEEGLEGLKKLSEAPGLAIRRAAQTEQNRKDRIITARLW